MKRNKLMTLFATALLWLGGQSANALTLKAVEGSHWGSNESPAQLVDGKQDTKWGNGGNVPHYAIFKADLPILPQSYVLRIANDTHSNTGRNWKTWKIYGANFASDVDVSRDASEWVLIDAKTDITLPTDQFATTQLTLSETNTTYFSYYKIEVEHLNRDGDYMQMDEFWFDSYSVDPTLAQKFKDFDPTGVNDYLATAYGNELQTLDAASEDAEKEAAQVKLSGLYDAIVTARAFQNFDLTGVAADLVAAYTAQLQALSTAADAEATSEAMNKLGTVRNEIAVLQAGNIYVLYNTPTWGDGLGSQLVDKNENTKWGGDFQDGERVQYVAFRLPAAMQPFFYKLVTGGDTGKYTGRNWKSWKLFAGNFASDEAAHRASSDWVLLDERTDVSEEYLPMKNTYPATFDFNKGVSEAYTYFKIEVYDAHNGNAIQMSELYLCTQEEFEAIREPLVAAFDDFDVAGLTVLPEDEADKSTFTTLLNELKTTADAVRLTKVYNELVALREKLEESASFMNGGYRVIAGNTAWGDGENWTKLLDGDESTKWGGGMPEGGSYVIFKIYNPGIFEQYMLVTGNDTKDSPDRNWKDWKIYGANFDSDEAAVRDTSTWFLIDEKSEIGQDRLPGDNFTPAFFNFSNIDNWNNDFKYFKIEVSGAYNNGGSIQMSEFKMLENADYRELVQVFGVSLNALKAEVFEGKEISEAIATEVDEKIAEFTAKRPKIAADDLLAEFAAARELILNAPKNSTIEVAQGGAECILPSMKWGGEYKAWTFVAQGDFDYGDWTEQNPNYNKIIGTPDAQDGKAWYEPEYSIVKWNYGQDLPNFGDERPADVYAVRYFTVEGEIPGTLYMPAAHDDAPCEYYINGQLIWAETDGWREDEVVRLTDAQKALIKTDGSVNVFAFHVHQNWGGRYADGGLYTAGNMVNDFNNDVRALDATIALAESEGIDAALIDFAKAKSAYRGGIGAGLAKLRQARRFAADARTEDFKGTAPADEMEVYLLNVGAKMFLAGGNDWGTHASLNHKGAKCVLRANSSGENRYAIRTNLPNGYRYDYDGLGHNGYVDCNYGEDFTTAARWAWEFKAVGDGSYYIINAENNKYLGMTDDDRLQVDTDKSGDDNPFNKWLLVTAEEFQKLAEDATPENPVDLGYMIHQSTFSQNDFDGDQKGNANADLNDSKWERNAGAVWNWKGNSAGGDYMFEMWNTGEVGYVYLIQEVEGLPAGNYTVSMTGYYRDGNFDSAIEGNVRQLAYMFAGSEDNCTPLPSVMAGDGKLPGYGRDGRVPDGCYDAAKFFQAGIYTTTIDAVVGADGKLKIGVYRYGADHYEGGIKGGDWITTDNWRLFYKGNPVEVSVTDAGYATFVAPGNITAIPEGVEAYAAQVVDNSYVHLEPVTAIPAGEAVVLKAEEGTYAMKATAFTAELGAENELKAATEEVTANGSQFILAKVNGKAGFAQALPDTKIAAGKGYLVLGAAGVKEFYPFNSDEETAIQAVDANADANAVIYNLAGQRISKAQKGINIVNGKKVLK